MKTRYSALTLLFSSLLSFGQKEIDSTFGQNGHAYLASPGRDLHWNTVKSLPDGKLFIGGSGIWRDMSSASSKIMGYELESSGEAISSFGEQGEAILRGERADYFTANSLFAKEFFPLADGKILITGHGTHNGALRIIAARLNANGSPDAAFGIKYLGPEFTSLDVNSAVQLTDGSVVIAGSGYDPVTQTNDYIALRLLPSGAQDANFGINGLARIHFGTNAQLTKILATPDNQLILSGFGVKNGRNTFLLAGLLPNGLLNSNFGTSGISQVNVSTNGEDRTFGAALHSNNTIVLVGSSVLPQEKEVITVTSLTLNGSLNTDFDYDGTALVFISGKNDRSFNVSIDHDGALYIAGITQQYNDYYFPVIIRLQENGLVDASFGENGILTFKDRPVYGDLELNNTIGLTLQSDGKPVICGTAVVNDRFNGRWVFRLKSKPIPPAPLASLLAKTAVLTALQGNTESPNEVPQSATIEIADALTGKLIASQAFSETATKNLEAGVYTRRVYNETGTLIRKDKFAIGR